MFAKLGLFLVRPSGSGELIVLPMSITSAGGIAVSLVLACLLVGALLTVFALRRGMTVTLKVGRVLAFTADAARQIDDGHSPTGAPTEAARSVPAKSQQH